MFVNNAAVLNRHFPAGELDHFRARAPVCTVKRGFFHLLRHAVLKTTPLDLSFALQGILGRF
jgi:hypothetical protein